MPTKRKYGEKPRTPKHPGLNESLTKSASKTGRHKDKRSKRGKDKKVDLSDLKSNED